MFRNIESSYGTFTITRCIRAMVLAVILVIGLAAAMAPAAYAVIFSGPGWVDTVTPGTGVVLANADMELMLPMGDLEFIPLQGVVEVWNSVGSEGTFDTEIVSMTLTGDSPSYGPVLLQNNTDMPSLGQVTELLDDELADSFFDVFFEMDFLGQTFITLAPSYLSSPAISSWPPVGAMYQVTPFSWRDASGNPTQFSVASLNLEVGPVVPEPTTAALLLLGLTTFGLRRRRKV